MLYQIEGKGIRLRGWAPEIDDEEDGSVSTAKAILRIVRHFINE